MSSHPLKILHTEWSKGWGGQEIRVLAECEAFREKGYQMHLAAPSSSKIYQIFKEKGFQVHDLPFLWTLDIITIIRVALLAKHIKADVIHTHSSIDGWIGGFASTLCGIPAIRSRHLTAPVKKGLKSKLLYRGLPSAVIASGRHIREHLIKQTGINPELIISAPGGVDESRFHPVSSEVKSSTRKEFQLSDDHYVIGIVAVLRSWKGHLLLLEAFQKVVTQHPRAKLVIAGDGPMREKIERRILELELSGSVQLIGHRKDVPQIMGMLDLFVLPSLKNEATSQVVPQAMMVGIPSIASTAGGLTEIVQDGKTGYSFEPNSSEAIAETIKKAIKTPEQMELMALNAREMALDHLTFKKMIERTDYTYRLVQS